MLTDELKAEQGKLKAEQGESARLVEELKSTKLSVLGSFFLVAEITRLIKSEEMPEAVRLGGEAQIDAAASVELVRKELENAELAGRTTVVIVGRTPLRATGDVQTDWQRPSSASRLATT